MILFVDILLSLLAYRGLRRAQLEQVVMNPGVNQALLGGVQAQRVAAQNLAHDILHPRDVMSLASSIATFFGAVGNLALVKAIIKAVADELTVWDAVKMWTLLMAQGVAMFTPAGPAVVFAKAVILAVALEGLLEDATAVVKDCA